MLTNNGHGSPDTNRIMAEKQSIRQTSSPDRKKRSFFWLYALIFLLILGGSAIFVFVRRAQAQTSLESVTQQMAVPTVLVVHPEQARQLTSTSFCPARSRQKWKALFTLKSADISNAGSSILALQSKKDNCWRKSKLP